MQAKKGEVGEAEGGRSAIGNRPCSQPVFMLMLAPDSVVACKTILFPHDLC
jgi:hypothetical protein